MASVTLKEKAYEQLRKLILNGNIQSNEHLTEKHLVEQLGMSRTPIRAALERLAVEGLVAYSPNKGLSLPELSIQRVVDFFDFRMALEGYIVFKLSQRHWDDKDMAWFRANLAKQAEFAQSRDFAAFTRKDIEFHRKLAALYENQEMVSMMDNLQDKLFLTGLRVLKKDNSRIQKSYEDHRDILEAMIAGKAEEARRLMIEHLEFGARILVL